jgi:hypothetical protein
MAATHPISPVNALAAMAQTVLRSYICMALCFSLGPEACSSTLLEALSNIIKQVQDDSPVLKAHVVVDSSTGKIFLDTSPKDVPILHQQEPIDLPSTFEELQTKGFPLECFQGPQIIDTVGDKDGSGPVSHFRYTLLPGGLIFWVYLHHSISDGVGAGMVLERLAAASRGEVDHSKRPLRTWPTEGSKLFELCRSLSTNEITARQLHKSFQSALDRCHEFTTGTSDGADSLRAIPILPQSPRPPSQLQGTDSAKIFVFKTSNLKQLAQEISNANPSAKPPSSHFALAVLTWACVTKARRAVPSANYTRSGIAKILVPVDWRTRAFQGQTDDFFGNGVVSIIPAIEACVVDLAADSLPASAPSNKPSTCTNGAQASMASLSLMWEAIHQTLQSIDDDYVANRVHVMGAPDPRRVYLDIDLDEESQIIFNTWRSFGSDLEWRLPGLASGRPVAIRRFFKGPNDGGMLVLPQMAGSDELDLMVSLKSEVMGELCKDKAWMRWVERVV